MRGDQEKNISTGKVRWEKGDLLRLHGIPRKGGGTRIWRDEALCKHSRGEQIHESRMELPHQSRKKKTTGGRGKISARKRQSGGKKMYPLGEVGGNKKIQ